MRGVIRRWAQNFSMKSKGAVEERGTVPVDERPEAARHALERLIELRTSVGDGLNDYEFTQLVAPEFFLDEEGFSMVCFSDGWVTLRTPPQDLSAWYSESGWLSDAKEAIAVRVAAKYDLSVCEPPDRLGYMAPPRGTHHHLELVNNREAVVVAHPLFLKIRLMSTAAGGTIWSHKHALPPLVELFQEIVELYTE